jgi:hypothetical protein
VLVEYPKLPSSTPSVLVEYPRVPLEHPARAGRIESMGGRRGTRESLASNKHTNAQTHEQPLEAQNHTKSHGASLRPALRRTPRGDCGIAAPFCSGREPPQMNPKFGARPTITIIVGGWCARERPRARPHVHTHACTHARTRARAHARTHLGARTHARTHACVRAHIFALYRTRGLACAVRCAVDVSQCSHEYPEYPVSTPCVPDDYLGTP